MSRASALLFCILLAAQAMPAQPLRVEPGIRLTEISEGWKCRFGDDLRWADPLFDDSGWLSTNYSTLTSRERTQNASDVGWCRVNLAMPSQSDDLSLLVGELGRGYEVYANGIRLGAFPAEFNRSTSRPRTKSWPIPTSAIGRHSPLVIALRIAGTRHGLRMGRGSQNISIGTSPGLEAMAAQANLYARLSGYLHWYLYLGAFFFVPLMIILYRNQPARVEYLWAAVFAALQGTTGVIEVLGSVTEVFSPLLFIRLVVLENLTLLAVRVEITALLFGMRHMRLIRIAQGITLLIGLTVLFSDSAVIPQTSYLELMLMPLRVAILIAVVPRLVSRSWERWVAGLLVIEFLVSAPNQWRLLRHLMGLPGTAANTTFLRFDGVGISLTGLLNLIWLVLIVGLVLRRYFETNRAHQRLAKEFEAARLVQQLLLRDDASTPGFAVEKVYLPAQEVGGDFYQVIPLPGSLLIVVGDVSGKGLKAAMQVSLVIGALRETAASKPADVLNHLNRVLSGQMDGGFVTCLCVRIDGNVLTVANAGHLSPYLSGQEMDVAGGLPLGLSLDAVYDETQFAFGAGDRLTLISDGVVEARSRSGELLGFARTCELSTQSAAAIADAAKAFGQDDDITVLTVQRTTC